LAAPGTTRFRCTRFCAAVLTDTLPNAAALKARRTSPNRENPVAAKKPTTSGARKRKPKAIAYINDACTGCAGSPVCLSYCPVPGCMNFVDDPDTVFGRVFVDPDTCIGCKKCTSKGPDDTFLDGCPWDAIEMVPTEDYEAEFGAVAGG